MRSDGRLGPGGFLLIGLALASFSLCAFEVLQIGLIADDYYAGHFATLHADTHPNLADRILSTFTTRWGPYLAYWHRPVLALTFQLDYAIFGVDGRLQHLTSLMFWLFTAAAAVGLSNRVFGARGTTAIAVFALALLYPAGVEALAWLIARDDILVTLFGLLTLRASLARPLSVVAPLPWLALALLSKETAVVLVPLLNLAGWVLPKEKGMVLERRVVAVTRVVAPWLLLAAWFGLRAAVLGSGPTGYGGKEYFGSLDPAMMLTNMGRALLQLVAPTTGSEGPLGIPALLTRSVFILSAVVILLAGFAVRRTGDLRRATFLLAGLLAPIVLLSPVVVVRDLIWSRVLVLPGVFWIMLLGLAFDRARSRPALRAAAIISLVGLLAAATMTFVSGLRPYVDASRVTHEAVRSLDAVPSGEDLAILGATDPVRGLRTDFIYFGIYLALGPPFRQGPPVRIATHRNVDELLAAREPRPWVAFLPPGRHVFQILARGGSEGERVTLDPPHASALDAAAVMTFRVTMPPEVAARVDSMSIVAVTHEGVEARADLAAKDVERLRQPGGSIEVPATTVHAMLSPEGLQQANVSVFLWWAEGRDRGGSVVFRSLWQAVAVPPDP